MHLKSRLHVAIAAHRRSMAVQYAARLCRAYLRAYDNVNHNLVTNGEASALRRLPPPVLTALDVGMHQGSWTDTLLEVQPGAVVHGFEPAPAMAVGLVRRYAGNRRVVVNPFALGATPGRAVLHIDPRSTSVSSLVVGPSTAGREPVEVDVVCGDDYLTRSDIGHVDVLKIDVEGYDLEVLLGFRRALAAGAIDVVQFEYNPWTLIARHLLADFYDLLDPLGYAIGKIHPSGVDFRPYDLESENWRGPACVAVLRSQAATITALANVDRGGRRSARRAP